MCQNEPWGTIAAPTEVHSKRKGQPLRMHVCVFVCVCAYVRVRASECML